MGKFTYENSSRIEIEDRALAHLQVVIGAKLRRGESFFFTWKDEASLGTGRSSVWLHRHSAIHFAFFGHRTPSLNRAWVDALAVVAGSPHGLYLVPEPQEVGEAIDEERVLASV
jgi:hypothetical protein